MLTILTHLTTVWDFVLFFWSNYQVPCWFALCSLDRLVCGSVSQLSNLRCCCNPQPSQLFRELLWCFDAATFFLWCWFASFDHWKCTSHSGIKLCCSILCYSVCCNVRLVLLQSEAAWFSVHLLFAGTMISFFCCLVLLQSEAVLWWFRYDIYSARGFALLIMGWCPIGSWFSHC